MSYDYISVEEVYRIWRAAMRAVNKDDKYILRAKHKFEFEMQVEKYKIQSVPTYVILKDGKEVDRIIGAKPKFAFLKRVFPEND